MQIDWFSKKGKLRKFNNDAVAFSYTDNFLVVTIADAAEKIFNEQVCCGNNKQGERLASYWVESCVTAITADKSTLKNKHKLFELIVGLQRQLRFYYLHDIACYGILIMDTKRNIANWYFVGDCLLGKEDEKGNINWLHKPHRVSELVGVPLETTDKNTLTKSLNARRFIYPEHLFIDSVKKLEKLVLATDGYWCEHLQDNIAVDDLEDDCSVLKIKFGNKLFSSKSDTANVLCFTQI